MPFMTYHGFAKVSTKKKNGNIKKTHHLVNFCPAGVGI
jgi:hypothetical protein